MTLAIYGKKAIVNSTPYSIDETGKTELAWEVGAVFTSSNKTTRSVGSSAVGARYVCILGHTASLVNAPGDGSGAWETYWRLIAEPWTEYLEIIDSSNFNHWFSDGSTTPPSVRMSTAGVPGVGDMLKSVYDTDNDGVVDLTAAVDWVGMSTGWVGTQAEYDAIGTKDANTVYFIKA